ncbi:MAG: hypothetical protein R2856_22035 [Caldilineaceae bacterium]
MKLVEARSTGDAARCLGRAIYVGGSALHPVGESVLIHPAELGVRLVRLPEDNRWWSW